MFTFDNLDFSEQLPLWQRFGVSEQRAVFIESLVESVLESEPLAVHHKTHDLSLIYDVLENEREQLLATFVYGYLFGKSAQRILSLKAVENLLEPSLN